MYRLGELYEDGRMLHMSRVSVNGFISDENAFFGSNGPLWRSRSNVKILKLKKDCEFIPIINVFGRIPEAGKSLSKSVFESNIISKIRTLKQLTGEQIDEIDITEEITKLYTKINSFGLDKISGNIIMGSNEAHHNNSYRKSAFIRRLLSTNVDRVVISDYGRSLIYPMYYVFNDRIIFTMVVKKDKISEFKNDFNEGKINPTNVEIWMDEDFLKTKDRRLFHKQLREQIPMKLTLEGFTIKEKKDILGEITYVPKIKFKSPAEIVNFKKNVNKLLLTA